MQHGDPCVFGLEYCSDLNKGPLFITEGLFGTPTNSPSLSVDLTDLPEEKKSDVIRLMRKSKATVVEV